MLERKTITIYALDVAPTVAITYNVSSEGVVENLQFWIKKDFQYNYQLLQLILKMMSLLEEIEPFSEVIEKDIYRAYQETFNYEILFKNYDLTIKELNTKKMVEDLVPHINFIKTNKLHINIFIKNYIEKGELK